VGPENVTEMAEEMGIEAPLESVPAEAIGGLAIGVTPLEMAVGYATLASGGIHHEPTAISRVEFPGPDGKVEETDPDSGERVLTEGQAYEVTRLLEGVITQGTGAGYTYMGCAAEAGKTGTSEELSDAWFVGYTPLYSTAVWVGHPQSREETGYGGPTAGPIWRSFMESAVAGDCPEFSEPATLPELSELDSDHTSGSYSGEYEYNEYEEEETTEEPSSDDEGDAGGAAAEDDAEAAPEAEPEPSPAPATPPSVGGGLSPG
jgi:penicillin-binding protein 1A